VAQGEGLGHDLWQALIREHRTVVWRATPHNPIGSWYVKQCDGMMRLPRWHVYWRGLELASVAPAIAEAIARPTDLEPAAVPSSAPE
jgi:acetylglutamate synthase